MSPGGTCGREVGWPPGQVTVPRGSETGRPGVTGPRGEQVWRWEGLSVWGLALVHPDGDTDWLMKKTVRWWLTPSSFQKGSRVCHNGLSLMGWAPWHAGPPEHPHPQAPREAVQGDPGLPDEVHLALLLKDADAGPGPGP